LRLQVEAVQRLPRIGGEQLQPPIAVVAADQAERFVWRGLLDAGGKFKRAGGRVAAETHVGQP